MSALLYIGGVLYLLAVIRMAGKRFEADHLQWHEQMRRATVGSVFTRNITVDGNEFSRQTKKGSISCPSKR